MVKKIIICLIILTCVNLLITHDSFSSQHHVLNSHSDRVHFEIGLLVIAIASGIYFLISGSREPSFQEPSYQPDLEQPGNRGQSLKSNNIMNFPNKLIVSPDKLILYEW
jgi:hypothetical protein